MQRAPSIAAPVRIRTGRNSEVINLAEISRRLGVDISAAVCAWFPLGGGWYRLIPDLSDPLTPLASA